MGATEQMTERTIQNTGKATVGALAMGFVGDAFNVMSAVGTMKVSQEEGDHIAVSAVKGGIDFVGGEIFYGAMAEGGLLQGLGGSLALAGVTVGANLSAQHMINTGQKIGQGTDNLKALGSGHFNMTQTGYTMRQRSLNAIRSNGANINSAFGNEARNYWLGI